LPGKDLLLLCQAASRLRLLLGLRPQIFLHFNLKNQQEKDQAYR
jgi:hypothetical protein